MAFFVIASLWLSFLGIIGFALGVGILYAIYRLDGGKLRFIPWYRAIQNQNPKSCIYISSVKLKLKIEQKNWNRFSDFAYCILVLCLVY